MEEDTISLDSVTKKEIGYFKQTEIHKYIQRDERIGELSESFDYNNGLIVELRYLGWSATLHKKGKEVQLQDISGNPIKTKGDDKYQRIINSALEKKDNFILSGRISDNGKNYYKFNADDILMLNDKVMIDVTLYDRLKAINTLEFTDGILQVQSYLVKDKLDLIEASMVLSKLNISSGINIRYPNKGYYDSECGYMYRPLTRVTAIVTNSESEDKYSIGFSKDESTLLCFDNIIQTKVKLKKGDIITLSVDDIKISDGGAKISLIYPIFCGKIGSDGLTSTQELLSFSTSWGD